MMIDIALLDGTSISVAAGSVIRFRQSTGSNEPQGTTMVDCGRVIFTREDMDSLAARLRPHLQLIRLTAPNGQPMDCDGRKISGILEASFALPFCHSCKSL
jgi:hypothetical protein